MTEARPAGAAARGAGPDGAGATPPEINAFLEGHLARHGAPGPVLDLGSGSGFWLDRMEGQGLRSVGVEPDFDRLRRGPARGAVADGAHLPLRSGAFGLVWCVHVLHHLPDPLGVLREVARVLQPGGHLVLAETVEDHPGIRIGRRVWPWWDGVHIDSRFTARDLVDLLDQAGLDVVERRQHSLVSFAAWALPGARRRTWSLLNRLEQRLPRGLSRFGAHVEVLARART
ncbi:MAG: class I SAM-dependent methyltransferase [Actinomycetota bacterium]